MTTTIILQDIGGVKREVVVISISKWKNARNHVLPNIEVRWPVAGSYILDLWQNKLVGAPAWGAEDIEAAWALWITKCPGRWRELKDLVPVKYRKSEPIIQATVKRSGEKTA